MADAALRVRSSLLSAIDIRFEGKVIKRRYENGGEIGITEGGKKEEKEEEEEEEDEEDEEEEKEEKEEMSRKWRKRKTREKSRIKREERFRKRKRKIHRSTTALGWERL